MVTTIQRWGNSLAIRIPKPFAQEAQLAEDSDVEMSVEAGRIIISHARKQWKLSDLLEDISPANRHREVKWGETRGKEVW